MKIQTQTAILFTVLAAGVILLLTAVIYYAARNDSSDDFRKRLELRVVVASKLRFDTDTTHVATYSELREQYLEVLPNEKEYIVPTDSISLQPRPPQALRLPAAFYRDVLLDSGTVYSQEDATLYAARSYTVSGRRWIVMKSAENVYGLQWLKHLRKILLVAFIGQVILVFTISFFFSRKALKPFRDIISRVNRIGVENLSLRLSEKKGTDEISDLSRTFNCMLDRLQTAFDVQNNFVSNASHELRTPLTTVIGEAEIALSKDRTIAEYKQSLEVILQESGKLEALTGALLSLAQSGFNKDKINFGPLRLDELLFDIKATIDRIDPLNKVRLDLDSMPSDEGPLTINGNFQLLKLALSNIILNACKYSNNQDVSVVLTVPARQALIVITDRGIGIPRADLRHVFVPFFRASNTALFKGYGVGLPLSMNIIRQHAGDIRMVSEEGMGTTVTVVLPVM